MTDAEVKQNDEKVFPIFYKKKVLSLKKTKELEGMMKELMIENEQIIANEKLMLDKIRIKDNEFVARLETHLQRYKNSNVERVILTSGMLPEWSPQKAEPSTSSDGNLPEIDDAVERLIEWYNAVDTYVSLQRDGVNQIISDWFSSMDKIASEGETDPHGTEVDAHMVDDGLVDSEQNLENAFWYIILILFCFAHMFIFFTPEAIDQCTDGFTKCLTQSMIKFCVFFHDYYLRFHNITLDYQSATSEVISVDNAAQCSSDA